MFYLYHHNDLGRLTELFAALRANNRPSPLQSDTVLVPNHGIGRWLTIQVAENEGIAANITTALPGGYVWDLLRAVEPGRPHGEHFEPEALVWHLYLALPAMADEIPAVAAYLGAPVDEVRRYQLASRLADVFYKYLVYRADMLAAWENGQTPDSEPGRWQAQVWRYVTRPDTLGRDHRAHLLADFAQRLGHDPALQRRVADYAPPALYCFALVVLPPDHLRLLYALASHVDVHFLFPNPSAAYWGDVTAQRLPLIMPEAGAGEDRLPGEDAVESGHPLLASLGRMARDTLRLLYCDEFAGMIEPELGEPMAYEQPEGDSLLHRIQSGIVTLDCGDARQGMADDDTSLEVHTCHSPLREVQVLQDQLLDRLAADDRRAAAGEISAAQRLAPRDIIVMLPDVAGYAPAIEAVFGGAPADRYLPFALADRARSAAHPIVSCFATLLDLPLSRWAASELLDILAVPAVMRRFGVTASELDAITNWVQSAGIRWGRDARHRAELSAGAFQQNSWRFGLDRLLLGVTRSDDQTLTDNVAPWADLEGGITAALGKLWRFEQTLAEAAAELAEAATPGRWQVRLNEVVDKLITPAPDAHDEQRAVDALRRIFSRFETAETCTSMAPLNADRTISWQAVRDMLRTQLNSASERQPFPAGGITFCGMVPLRAVPFRVVCILGLNDDAFPREDTGRAFNVMFQQPRLGDRNTRDDDRLLFLQALTAAGNAFYLSYIGQDVHTGETRPPSPVVDELLEFTQQYYFGDRSRDACHERLVHKQPMQPFSARYFSPAETDPRIFTFAGGWRDASIARRRPRTNAEPWLDGTRAPLAEPGQSIDLATLVRFFDDPPRAFFEGRLGLSLDRRATHIEDQEPIELDDLDQAILRRRLFEGAAAAGASSIEREPDALELARGTLPPPPRAASAFAGQADIVNALLPTQQAWQTDRDSLTAVDIDLTLTGRRLTGRVGDIGPTHMRRVHPGRLKTRHRLRHWIEYLAVVASGHEVTLALAGLGSKKQNYRPVAVAGAVCRQTARDHLACLIECYVEGRQTPLAFHPDLVDDYDPAQPDAFDNLAWRFSSSANPRSRHHLLGHSYFPLLLGADEAPLGTADNSPFLEAINRIWLPMHETLEDTAVAGPADAQAPQ